MITLLEGDCLELLPGLESGSVDMILCDLPYGTTACAWDVVIPFPPLWEQYRRVIKQNGAIVLFGTQPFTSVLIASNLDQYKYSWVWEKNRPTGFINANRRPMKATEDICVFGDAIPYNPQGTRQCGKLFRNSTTKKTKVECAIHDGGRFGDSYKQNRSNYPQNIIRFSADEEGYHPTQKPVALCSYLIRTYTNKGETVLDNTTGSGTTGVACIETGRSFIGIERDPEYFQIAKRRIEEAQRRKAENPVLPFEEVTA